MKNLIIVGVVGLLLFGTSFAGSTLMLQKDVEPEDSEQVDGGKLADNGEKYKVSAPLAGGKQDSKDQMPGTWKPKTLTEESVLKMVESIKKQEKLLNSREKEILDRESRHQFILNDIQREKREYEAVVQQVQAKIEQAKRLLRTVEEKKAQIVAEQKKIQLIQTDIDNRSTPQAVSEQKNIKKIAEWIGSMPAEDAAETFKRYANDGKLVMAAQILRQIEERTAAKILTALNDPVLVTDILDEFKKTPQNDTKLR